MNPKSQILSSAIVVLLLLVAPCRRAAAAGYDPLALPDSAPPKVLDLVVHDTQRDRKIPVLVYLPQAPNPAPVILYSHGLGGTRHGSSYLGGHWARRGYVAVFLQHPGSDDSVWKGKPRRNRMREMRRAASGRNYLLRAQDVPAVLDRLRAWNGDAAHHLAGRLDLEHVGMSGHSFGAVTTQAVSGQSAGLRGQRFTDPRIQAAIAFSPNTPSLGRPQTAFGEVSVPWMLMTGTRDTAPIGGKSVADRLNVYPHLPDSIDKYELVLHNAEHSAFTDRALPGDTEKRNPNHHQAILALSTAFWDTHLLKNDDARQWLHGKGAKSVLEDKDRWQLQVAQPDRN